MGTEDRFKQAIVVTLAKRSANQCANPDCGAITSGPTANPSDSVNVGEAAHIYGANPGSARYDAQMSAAERSAIENAVWLCRSCHKIIDDDPSGHPAGLLFEWQRAHEFNISQKMGKRSAEIRKKYETRHLEEFGRLSHLAERIVLEKGDFWEYRLTAEVLRYEISPIVRRWQALTKGLYVKPRKTILFDDFAFWIGVRVSELLSLSHAFEQIVNAEFARSWGPPGQPGDDMEIVTTARLLAEMCQSALNWEEEVRFLNVDNELRSVAKLFAGVAGTFIEEAQKIPNFFSETISPTMVGHHSLKLSLTVPEEWAKTVKDALSKAIDSRGNR